MRRARDLGIPFDGQPGTWNAITDVPGVEVGHTTLIQGEGALQAGQGPVRTGVTVVLPRGKTYDPVFAGWYSFNGCGEMTGTAWLEESGFLESGIALTNTTSVGVVREAMVQWATRRLQFQPGMLRDVFWFLPVVTETADLYLNDMAGSHVKAQHVEAALDSAAAGVVAEGNVGGGTGMVCFGFKGGIGTASRLLPPFKGLRRSVRYRVGVLVQANFGERAQLTVAGVPVGRLVSTPLPEVHWSAAPQKSGSIVVVVATDAPLLPQQLKRLARRAPLGIGRLGGIGANSSGDLCLAFSTGNPGAARQAGLGKAAFLPNAQVDPLLEAVIQATEEAILNALVAARTMTGINGNTVHALPHDQVVELFKKYPRLG